MTVLLWRWRPACNCPDCVHRVYFHPAAGNYIVVRPGAKGNYGEAVKDFLISETPAPRA